MILHFSLPFKIFPGVGIDEVACQVPESTTQCSTHTADKYTTYGQSWQIYRINCS